MTYILLLAFGLLLTAYAFLLWRLQPIELTTIYIDPYAADVADFRRQVSDWDRGGS